MKRFKNIVTRILRFPIEETGIGPLALLFITIVVLAEIMKKYYH